jgi:hypothetical protein
MGLTASENSYTLAIFLNCRNIHYLLKVICGSHFSTFSHILHKMVYLLTLLERQGSLETNKKKACAICVRF